MYRTLYVLETITTMKLRLFHLRAILIFVIASIHTMTHPYILWCQWHDFYGFLFVSNTHIIKSMCFREMLLICDPVETVVFKNS